MSDPSEELRATPPEEDPASRETLARNPGKILFPPTPPEALQPEQLPRRHGKYTLLEELGHGGMGRVYRALDKAMNREVAIKIFRQSWEEGQVKRFRLEVESLARLHHSNIVGIYEAGELDGKHFFSMEYVRGRNFREVLDEMAREGRCDVAMICTVVAQIAYGLDHAHNNGVIHRDVKPQNIMIAEDGSAKLLDFGLAKEVGGQTLSHTGSVVGTPYYMSPEQVAGRNITVDPRTDVYSLGIVLYEALTFKIPFEGETTHQVYRQILMKDPGNPRQANSRLARDLVTITMKAIEKDPEKRYATCKELGDDLHRFLNFETIQARPAGWFDRLGKRVRRNPVAATAVGILTLVLLALLGWRIALSHLENQEFQARLAEATKLLEKGSFDESLTALRRLEGIQPDHPDLAVLVRRCEQVLEKKQRRENSALSLDLLDQARTAYAEHEVLSQDRKRLLAEVRQLRTRIEPYMPLDFQSGLLDAEAELEQRLEQSWARLEYAIVLLLSSLKADEEQEEARTMLIELALAKYREAQMDDDRRQLARFRSLFDSQVALVDDPAQRAEYEKRMRDLASVMIHTDPVGARAFLFRYREIDRRLAPVPFHPEKGEEEGFDRRPDLQGPFRFLRVISVDESSAAHQAGLRRDDKIVLLDGRIALDADEARQMLLSDRVEEVVLSRDGQYHVLPWILPSVKDAYGDSPAELHLELEIHDAYPIHCSDFNDMGTTPLRLEDLPGGTYLLLLRRAGFADVRYPMHLNASAPGEVQIRLLRADDIPPGFVRVPAGPFMRGADRRAQSPRDRERVWVDDFFIAEKEITFDEYIEFVNDFARGDPELMLQHAPRYSPRSDHLMTVLDGFLIRREDIRPGTPVCSISWEDAWAFCRWKSEKARLDGKPWEYTLPTEDQWAKAARGPGTRPFVWGSQFVPSFCSGSGAERHEVWRPGAIFPLDVSVYGVRDMAGSVCEYCTAWFNEDLETRPIRGGAWGLGQETDFRIGSRAGAEGHLVSASLGIRLVCRRRE